jgi:hypothetical protein
VQTLEDKFSELSTTEVSLKDEESEDESPDESTEEAMEESNDESSESDEEDRKIMWMEAAKERFFDDYPELSELEIDVLNEIANGDGVQAVLDMVQPDTSLKLSKDAIEWVEQWQQEEEADIKELQEIESNLDHEAVEEYQEDIENFVNWYNECNEDENGNLLLMQKCEGTNSIKIFWKLNVKLIQKKNQPFSKEN